MQQIKQSTISNVHNTDGDDENIKGQRKGCRNSKRGAKIMYTVNGVWKNGTASESR